MTACWSTPARAPKRGLVWSSATRSSSGVKKRHFPQPTPTGVHTNGGSRIFSAISPGRSPTLPYTLAAAFSTIRHMVFRGSIGRPRRTGAVPARWSSLSLQHPDRALGVRNVGGMSGSRFYSRTTDSGGSKPDDHGSFLGGRQQQQFPPVIPRGYPLLIREYPWFCCRTEHLSKCQRARYLPPL